MHVYIPKQNSLKSFAYTCFHSTKISSSWFFSRGKPSAGRKPPPKKKKKKWVEIKWPITLLEKPNTATSLYQKQFMEVSFMQHLLCQLSTVILILGSTKIVLRNNAIFWGVTSCSLVDGYLFTKLWHHPRRQQSSITAVRTSNHIIQCLSMSYFQNLKRLQKNHTYPII